MNDNITNLYNDIEKLRIKLNEKMSENLFNDSNQYNSEILRISQRLDKLIVQYISLTKEASKK